MDTMQIPKTFWHSISIAILVVTCGLVVIAYRSVSISIEVANTKIELLSTIEQTSRLNDTIRRNNTIAIEAAKQQDMTINNEEHSPLLEKNESGEKMASLSAKSLHGIEYVDNKQFDHIDARLNELRKILSQ